MSTIPTLRRVGGRRHLGQDITPPPSPLAVRCTPKHLSTIPPAGPSTQADDQKTESVGSEHAEPSTSYLQIGATGNRLEDSFPSVLRILSALTRACIVDKDSQSFVALADMLVNNVANITASIQSSKHVDPTTKRYLVAKWIVYLLLNIFIVEIDKVACIEALYCCNPLPEMQLAHEYAKMLHESLAVLFRIGLKVVSDDKPLPSVPGASDTTSTGSTTTTSLYSVHRDSWVHVPSDTPPSPEPAQKSWRRIRLHNDKDSRPSRLRTDSSASSKSTKVPRPPPSPPTPIQSTFEAPRSEEIYNQRWTTVFYGNADFASVRGNLEEGTDGVQLDKENRIQAGSLPALIRILTSREGVQDPGLSQSIFKTFRLFTSPEEFFEELKRRFFTRPPSKGMSSEDAERWRVNISNIHARVLGVLYCWLDQHWQGEYDNILLDDMRVFAEDRKEADLPKGTVARILAKIQERERDLEADIFDTVAHPQYPDSSTPPPPPPTNFVFPPTFPHSSTEVLSLLDVEDGREELARHLTMKMSDLYRNLDPSRVVQFWYKEGDKARDYGRYEGQADVKALAALSAYGERLTLWVMSSIIEEANCAVRVGRLAFWVDIASRCVAHRDFATAHNIFVSLSFSSVLRLKESLLRVPLPYKLQYKMLAEVFDDRNNTLFKKSFDDRLPSLPSTTPLLREIIQAKVRAENQARREKEGSIASEKLIALDECKVAQQAISALNKARRIKYEFDRNEEFSWWLEDRFQDLSFSTDNDKIHFYDRLHQTSKDNEPRQKGLDFIAIAWEFGSTKPNNPLKGKITRLHFPGSDAAAEQKKRARRLLGLLNDLRKTKS